MPQSGDLVYRGRIRAIPARPPPPPPPGSLFEFGMRPTVVSPSEQDRVPPVFFFDFFSNFEAGVLNRRRAKSALSLDAKSPKGAIRSEKYREKNPEITYFSLNSRGPNDP